MITRSSANSLKSLPIQHWSGLCKYSKL